MLAPAEESGSAPVSRAPSVGTRAERSAGTLSLLVPEGTGDGGDILSPGSPQRAGPSDLPQAAMREIEQSLESDQVSSLTKQEIFQWAARLVRRRRMLSMSLSPKSLFDDDDFASSNLSGAQVQFGVYGSASTPPSPSDLMEPEPKQAPQPLSQQGKFADGIQPSTGRRKSQSRRAVYDKVSLYTAREAKPASSPSRVWGVVAGLADWEGVYGPVWQSEVIADLVANVRVVMSVVRDASAELTAPLYAYSAELYQQVTWGFWRRSSGGLPEQWLAMGQDGAVFEDIRTAITSDHPPFGGRRRFPMPSNWSPGGIWDQLRDTSELKRKATSLPAPRSRIGMRRYPPQWDYEEQSGLERYVVERAGVPSVSLIRFQNQLRGHEGLSPLHDSTWWEPHPSARDLPGFRMPPPGVLEVIMARPWRHRLAGASHSRLTPGPQQLPAAKEVSRCGTDRAFCVDASGTIEFTAAGSECSGRADPAQTLTRTSTCIVSVSRSTTTATATTHADDTRRPLMDTHTSTVFDDRTVSTAPQCCPPVSWEVEALWEGTAEQKTADDIVSKCFSESNWQRSVPAALFDCLEAFLSKPGNETARLVFTSKVGFNFHGPVSHRTPTSLHVAQAGITAVGKGRPCLTPKEFYELRVLLNGAQVERHREPALEFTRESSVDSGDEDGSAEGAGRTLDVEDLEKYFSAMSPEELSYAAEDLGVVRQPIPTANAIANGLSMQRLRYTSADGRLCEYVVALSGDPHSHRVHQISEDGDPRAPKGEPVMVNRVADLADVHPYFLVNNVLRKIQMGERLATVTVNSWSTVARSLLGVYTQGSADTRLPEAEFLRPDGATARLLPGGRWEVTAGASSPVAPGSPGLSRRKSADAAFFGPYSVSVPAAAVTVELNGAMMMQVREFILHIESALNRMPLPVQQVKNYRGLADVHLPHEVYDDFKVVCWPAFSSSSSDQGVASGFATGERAVIFLLTGHKCRDISLHSRFAREREWLYPPNTLFQITKSLGEEMANILGKQHLQAFHVREITQKEAHEILVRKCLIEAHANQSRSSSGWATTVPERVMFKSLTALSEDGVVELGLSSPREGATPDEWQYKVLPPDDPAECPIQPGFYFKKIDSASEHHATIERRYNKLKMKRGVVEVLHLGDVARLDSSSEDGGDDDLESLETCFASENGYEDFSSSVGMIADVHAELVEEQESYIPMFTVTWTDLAFGPDGGGMLRVLFRKKSGRDPLCIKVDGAAFLGTIMRIGVPFTRLQLQNNALGEEGATHLLESLRMCNTIQEIVFDETEIGVGRRQIPPKLKQAIDVRCLAHASDRNSSIAPDMDPEVAAHALWDIPDWETDLNAVVENHPELARGVVLKWLAARQGMPPTLGQYDLCFLPLPVDYVPRDRHGGTYLHLAAGALWRADEGHTAEAAIRELLALGASVNAHDNKGMTPLHHCAMGNLCSLPVLNALLELDADPSELDYVRESALHKAARSGTPQALHRLLRCGRGVSQSLQLVSNAGKTVLICAAMNQLFDTPLGIECVRHIGGRGIGIHVADADGRTALWHAAAAGAVGLVECLLDFGADAALVDKNGASILNAATQFRDIPDDGSRELVKGIFAYDLPSGICTTKRLIQLGSDVGWRGPDLPVVGAARVGLSQLVKVLMPSRWPFQKDEDVELLHELRGAGGTVYPAGHTGVVCSVGKDGTPDVIRVGKESVPCPPGAVSLLRSQQASQLIESTARKCSPECLRNVLELPGVEALARGSVRTEAQVTTILHRMARNPQTESDVGVVVLSSLATPELINKQNENQRTPLWYACNSGMPRVVAKLLEMEGDVTLQDKIGNSAMHEAASHPSCALAVIRSSVTPAAKERLCVALRSVNRSGASPLHLMVGKLESCGDGFLDAVDGVLSLVGDEPVGPKLRTGLEVLLLRIVRGLPRRCPLHVAQGVLDCMKRHGCALTPGQQELRAQAELDLMLTAYHDGISALPTLPTSPATSGREAVQCGSPASPERPEVPQSRVSAEDGSSMRLDRAFSGLLEICVVLDFDRTLTTVHLTEGMDPERAFGGAERLALIRAMLQNLRGRSSQVVVLTNNHESLVEDALRKVDLRGLVQLVQGRHPDLRSKADGMRKLMAALPSVGRWLLVDNEPSNLRCVQETFGSKVDTLLVDGGCGLQDRHIEALHVAVSAAALAIPR